MFDNPVERDTGPSGHVRNIETRPGLSVDLERAPAFGSF
jgi:hypothetical protein